VSSDVPLGFVPQENTIFGAVTETYDALRSPSLGKDLFVRGELTLAVQHCLIARKGVKSEDINHIASHEQVCIQPSAKV
jgi:prephenate dehydratase